MDAKGIAILNDPHPCGHIVYPYTDKNLVGHAACLFAMAGLLNGEGVVLIAAKAHYETINPLLEAEGFDLAALQRTGQLTCMVAEDLLAKFMPYGKLDETLFKTTIGGLIDRARASTSDGGLAKVRVFGEMVSLLRMANLGATTRLEELWNGVIDTYSVSVLCTYALNTTAQERAIPQPLIDLHSHNLAA